MCGKPNKKVPCFVCTDIFSTKRDMLKHVSHVHNVGDNNMNKENVICDKCKVVLNGKSSLKRHIKQVHLKMKTKIKKSFKCIICNHSYTKSEMLIHYNSEHNVDISTESLTFLNFESFMNWKYKLERETITKFIRYRTKVVEGKGSVIYFYKCHRDGWFNTCGKQIRSLKSSGSNKINGYCPAMIKVEKCKGQFNIKYLKSHVGHEMEVRRLSLSSDVKKIIADKLASNIPLETIIEEVKLSFESMDRASFVTKKDLYNIRNSFGITSQIYKEDNECFLVDKWVQDWRIGNEKSSIRFYKAKGQFLANYPQLEISDCILVFMEDCQLEKLKECCNNLVCIDPILDHLTPKDVKITTIIVGDDTEMCFPCASLFANRQDIDILNVFFTVLSLCVGYSIKPKVLFTDVSEIYYSSWSIVMETPDIFYYNGWSLEIDWTKQLRKNVKSVKKQASVFERLQSLVKEQTETDFQESMNTILRELKSDAEMEEFARFFESSYKPSAIAWAPCFRSLSAELITNLERIHKSIEYMYKEGRRNKHLNEVIQLVLEFTKEKFYREGNFIKQIGEVTQRHRACLEGMSNFLISEEDENCWSVSLVNKKAHFKIKRILLNCFCEIRCIDCAVCIHSFVCTCPDFFIMWNMCIHIHLVCQFIIQTNIIADQLRGLNNVSECTDQLINNAPEIDKEFRHINDVHEVNNTNDIFIYDDLLEKTENELDLVVLNEVPGNIVYEKKLLKTQFEELLNIITSFDQCQLAKTSLDSIIKNIKTQTFSESKTD